eukprot:COSAG02_NODE_4687_length_5092_cov_2.075506_6_plen_63_part_00
MKTGARAGLEGEGGRVKGESEGFLCRSELGGCIGAVDLNRSGSCFVVVAGGVAPGHDVKHVW